MFNSRCTTAVHREFFCNAFANSNRTPPVGLIIAREGIPLVLGPRVPVARLAANPIFSSVRDF